MVHNTAVVVGIEAMAAAQGLDLHSDALPSSPQLEAQRQALRQRVPFLAQDRFMAPDIEAMKQWALHGSWPQAIAQLLPSHLD